MGIDIATVQQVLLNDGWHVVANKSFIIDLYEFVDVNGNLLSRNVVMNEAYQNGAKWMEVQGGNSQWVCAPFTAIMAVKVTR